MCLYVRGKLRNRPLYHPTNLPHWFNFFRGRFLAMLQQHLGATFCCNIVFSYLGTKFVCHNMLRNVATTTCNTGKSACNISESCCNVGKSLYHLEIWCCNSGKSLATLEKVVTMCGKVLAT